MPGPLTSASRKRTARRPRTPCGAPFTRAAGARHRGHRRVPVRVPGRAGGRRRASTGRATVFFHLDEYVGMPDTHPGELPPLPPRADRDKVRPGQFHFIEGDAPDPKAERARVGELIARTPSTSPSSASARTATSRSTTRPPTSRPRSRTSSCRSTRPAAASSSARAGSRASRTCRSARSRCRSARSSTRTRSSASCPTRARRRPCAIASRVRQPAASGVDPAAAPGHDVYLDAPSAALLTKGKDQR